MRSLPRPQSANNHVRAATNTPLPNVTPPAALGDSVPSAAALVVDEAAALVVVAVWLVEVVFRQTTSSGVSTPWAEQIWRAYSTAASWPASSHVSATQQAMSLRKFSLPQMQAMSSCWQPAICWPEVNWLTQGTCCRQSKRDVSPLPMEEKLGEGKGEREGWLR